MNLFTYVYQDSNYNTKLTEHSFQVIDRSLTPRSWSIDHISNMNETTDKSRVVTVRGKNLHASNLDQSFTGK